MMDEKLEKDGGYAIAARGDVKFSPGSRQNHPESSCVYCRRVVGGSNE